MLAMNMLKFRRELDREGVVFCYSGYITEDVLVGIGKALKSKLEMETTDKKVIRGLFSIFVEQVQNVIRYSAEKEYVSQEGDAIELRYGMLTVGKQEGKFFVSCSNIVNTNDVESLSRRLSTIQGLNHEELRTLYKESLKKDPPESSKGAGVGFIDIARRATNGFEFDFTNLDANQTYFVIKAFV